MGALVGLGFGIGLLLIWAAFSVPRRPRPEERRPGRLQQRLVRAGLGSVAPRRFVALCLTCSAAVFAVIQVISGAPPVAMAFGLLAGYLPVAIVGVRVTRRQRELAVVWPEAVDNLASAVRAGLSLPEALGALATRGPEPLRPAFESFALDYQVSGRFTDALDRLKANLADPVGDRVVEALRIAREVGGGDLGRLLRSLSAYLRDDARTRSELESRQAWTINGARLAVAAPWVVLFFLCFQPEVIGRYASTAGAAVIFGGAACCLIAYRLMLRIGRLPVDERILA